MINSIKLILYSNNIPTGRYVLEVNSNLYLYEKVNTYKKLNNFYI